MIPAIECNFPQSEIADASYRYQRSVEEQERVIVGVTRFTQEEAERIEIMQIDGEVELAQARKVRALRETRHSGHVRAALDALKTAAETGENTMPRILDAVRAYATTGEICRAFAGVFGGWQERSAL